MLWSLFGCQNSKVGEIDSSDTNIKKLKDSLSCARSKIDSQNEIINHGYYARLIDSSINKYLYFDEVNKEVVGLAEIEGYYSEVEKMDMSQVKSICDCFVITSGPKILREYISNLIKQGNTIYDINSKGEPIIGIDLQKLNTQESEILKMSSKSNKVKLVIFKRPPTYQCAPICESTVDILKVWVE